MNPTYFDTLIPSSVSRIQKEVRKERDLLDHKGSLLRDEYPDKEALLYLTEVIYERISTASPTPTFPDLFLTVEDTTLPPAASAEEPINQHSRDAEGRAPFLFSPLYDLVRFIVVEEVREMERG